MHVTACEGTEKDNFQPSYNKGKIPVACSWVQGLFAETLAVVASRSYLFVIINSVPYDPTDPLAPLATTNFNHLGTRGGPETV